MELSSEDYAKLQSQIPYFDADPKYRYLADKKLLPQQRGIESFENAPFLTGLRRSLFGMTKEEQRLVDQQQTSLVPFDQEQSILAMVPQLADMQAIAPSIRPTAAQMQTVEGPRPTGPGFLGVPAQGPGLPKQRDLMSTDAFLSTLSPQEMSDGRFQQELNQRGPGTYQEGLRPTTLQPTGADVELYGPGAPIERQIPGVKPNMAQLGAYQSLLAGHTLDPDSTMVTPALQASRETPVEVNPGNTLVTRQGQPLYTAPGRPTKDNEELRKFEGVLSAAGIDAASPMGKQLYTEWAKKISTHQPAASQTVNMKQETEEAKMVGGGFGKQFIQLQDSAMAANNKLNKLDRLSSLMEGVDTGKLAPSMTQLQALGKDLGFNVDPSLGAKQAIMALTNEMALELRNPSGGAGMPGAMSDSDRNFLVEMTPGLSKTPEGNRLIIETARKVAKRDQDVAKLARQYRKKNGHLDEGFYDELQSFADKHPLFKAAAPAPSAPAAPDAGRIEGGYRFKGGDASKRENWEKVK